MNLALADDREALLAAAWDEATAPYPVPGTTLLIRPFSANALRRAGTMRLRCLWGPFGEMLAAMRPTEALVEIEALAWLLSADLETVKAAMRTRTWQAELSAWELPRGVLRHFHEEMVRVMALIEAAKFDIEEKPKAPAPVGRSAPADPEPPAHQVRPGMLATLAFALADKVGRPADELLEWVPVCQIFQLAHCQQWGNPTIWTVDPVKAAALAPHEAIEPAADPGFGEAIEF